MSKLTTYMVIIIVITTFLSLAGFQLVSTGLISTFLDNFANLKFSNFFDSANDLIIDFAITGTIIVGFLAPSRTEWVILTVYSGVLLAFVADIVSISTQISDYASWISTPILLFMGMLAILYTHAVISWWLGRAD